jgi:hypothetical protein
MVCPPARLRTVIRRLWTEIEPFDFTELPSDHRVQFGHPRHALGQTGLGQPAPRGVHQLDVVMLLGPVISYEQAQRFPPFSTPIDTQQPAGEPSAN